MRMRELIKQPRLSYPRLADDGDHLATASARMFQGLAQCFDLAVAPDESRKAARGRGL